MLDSFFWNVFGLGLLALCVCAGIALLQLADNHRALVAKKLTEKKSGD